MSSSNRQRENIIEDLKKRKFTYETGYWNADTVYLGGLGNEPEPDSDTDPLVKLKNSLEESKAKVNKIQFFKNNEPDNKEE